MKLQGFGIIFALIVLPLILVLTYYIKLQIDTLSIQKSYDSKLIDSTADALSAFELNTANEDFSTVSDSLRSITEASCNVFITTLATNLGMSNASKSHIEPYVPALLYTLYDGYYIYAPTQVPNVLTNDDGVALSVGDLGVKISGGYYSYDPEPKRLSELAIDDPNHEDPDVNDYISAKQLENASHNLEDYGQLLYVSKTNKNLYTTNIEDAEKVTKNILKTYMLYSARYKQDDIDADVTVVYTLDNYLTINGSIRDEYYSKSGYLIPKDSVKVFLNGATNADDLYRYNQDVAKKIIEEGNNFKVVICDENGNENASFTNETNERYEDLSQSVDFLNNRIQKLREYKTLLFDDADKLAAGKAAVAEQASLMWNRFGDPAINGYIAPVDANSIYKMCDVLIENSYDLLNQVTYKMDVISAGVYYARAAIFSNWVHTELDGLRENSIVEISGQDYRTIVGDQKVDELVYDFDSTDNIFDLKRSKSAGGTTTERDTDINYGYVEINKSSVFYTHKHAVIRNSIQYNLNLAMSTYNASMSLPGHDYQMPVLQNEEWEQILDNVSIVSFMQGFKCGLKTYNNYKVVSSTNNEIVVKTENMFFVNKDLLNDRDSEYHRINCAKLLDINNPADKYIAFSSKEVKYDKQYDKNRMYAYVYDHMNLACYHCVNDYNNKRINLFDETADNYEDVVNLRKAFYIGIAKERNNTYKLNSVVESEGYEIVYLPGSKDPNTAIAHPILKSSKHPMKKVKAIEVTVGTAYATDLNETILTYEPFILNGTEKQKITSSVYSIPTNSIENHTMVIEVDPNLEGSKSDKLVSKGSLYFEIKQQQSSSTYDPNTTIDTPPEGEGTEADYYAEKDKIFKSYIKEIRVIYK